MALLTIFILPPVFLFQVPRGLAGPAGRYAWPVGGRVLRGFEKPTGPYGEGGHQGIDIATDPGTTVRSAGDGTVLWVGEVPRGRFVTVGHDGGVRTTYLDLDMIDVSRGQGVARGQVLGTVSGARDSSSSEPHLHFGAYLHGTPVDPLLLLRGADCGSYIRLCPVDGAARAMRPGRDPVVEAGGFWTALNSGLRGVTRMIADPVEGAFRGLRAGLGFLWKGVSAAAGRVGSVCARAWTGYIHPALAEAGRALLKAFKWVWSNRWVQAVVAALAAAAALAVAIALLVVVLSLSFVVAVVTAIAAVAACLVAAIVYAAMHPGDFSFRACFFKSLSAGVTAACAAGSLASLAGALAAGWAGLGWWGTLKAAFWSGAFSGTFEASSSFLLTGRIDWKNLLIACGVGALSGVLSRLIIKGITASSRLVEAFAFSLVEARGSLKGIDQALKLVLQKVTITARGLVIVLRNPSISIGTRVAYATFSGSLGLGLNAAVCALTGKPITLSSSLASFFAGAAMGTLALAFRGKGIGGFLEKMRFFRVGLGRHLKRLVSGLISKITGRGIKTGLKRLFSKLLKEEAVE